MNVTGTEDLPIVDTHQHLNEREPYVWLRGVSDSGWVYDFQGFRVVLDLRGKVSAPEPKHRGKPATAERLAQRPG